MPRRHLSHAHTLELCLSSNKPKSRDLYNILVTNRSVKKELAAIILVKAKGEEVPFLQRDQRV